MKTVSEFLLNQLKVRQQKNKNYSQRGFARDLGVGPGRLSDIINGKTTIGNRLLEKLITKLKLTENEIQEFKVLFQQQTAKKKTVGNFSRYLSQDEYTLIAQPKHYYILALLETSNRRQTTDWMARRLGVSEAEIQEMIDRLIDMKLIRREGNGRLKTSPGGVTTTHDVPSEVIRESHRAVILDSLDRLRDEPVDKRDFTSITMAANPKNLAAAKRLTSEYRRRLCKLLESGKKSEVYTLNIQLFRNTFSE